MDGDRVVKMGADGRDEDKPGWHQGGDQSFDEWMDPRVARYDTRQDDWEVLRFQADLAPKYRRAQIRYLGTGVAG